MRTITGRQFAEVISVFTFAAAEPIHRGMLSVFRSTGDIRSQKSIGRARTPPQSLHSRRRKKKRKSINKETIYIEAIDSFSSNGGAATHRRPSTPARRPSSVCAPSDEKIEKKSKCKVLVRGGFNVHSSLFGEIFHRHIFTNSSHLLECRFAFLAFFASASYSGGS